jgi:hypothetical protein
MCGIYDASLLNECFDSRMDENHGWMYGGQNKGGAHSKEWMNKLRNLSTVNSLYQTIVV